MQRWEHAGLDISKGYVAPKQKQGIDDQRFITYNGLTALNACLQGQCLMLMLLSMLLSMAPCAGQPQGAALVCVCQPAAAGCAQVQHLLVQVCAVPLADCCSSMCMINTMLACCAALSPLHRVHPTPPSADAPPATCRSVLKLCLAVPSACSLMA